MPTFFELTPMPQSIHEDGLMMPGGQPLVPLRTNTHPVAFPQWSRWGSRVLLKQKIGATPVERCFVAKVAVGLTW